MIVRLRWKMSRDLRFSNDHGHEGFQEFVTVKQFNHNQIIKNTNSSAPSPLSNSPLNPSIKINQQMRNSEQKIPKYQHF